MMGRKKAVSAGAVSSTDVIHTDPEGEGENEEHKKDQEDKAETNDESGETSSHMRRRSHPSVTDEKETVTETEDEDKEVTSQAVMIVRSGTEAAAIAQENRNSAEETKHREMLATLREDLSKEEAALVNDLETHSTPAEREEAEKEEKTAIEERQRSRSSSHSSSISSVSLGAQSVTSKQPDGSVMSSLAPPPPPLASSTEDGDQTLEELVPELSPEDQEVMSVLNVMCHTVMERIDDRYDVYDEYLDLWDQKDRPNREDELIGCQVSILVHVDDTLKQNMYLYDLQSQDLAVMLSNQLLDRNSPLNTGNMTKHVVGIQHKSAFSKRQFKEWEHLWVHMLSPTYFRYCTKPSKRERFVAPREPGRLKSGVLLVNPTDSFTENQKEVFMGLIQPKSKFEIDDPNAAATLNFDVDDIGAELFDASGAAKLVIYRPNLNTLTKREVEKCKRIYRGFLDKYNAEMTFGLARGGLRANQYAALKDMDTAKRIYDLAKQKLNRDLRAESDGPAYVPQITNISVEQFAEWQNEAKQEEAELLREKKLKKIQQGVLRKQEAEMRRRYTQQKNWM